jgi:phage tail-like protein
MPTVIRDDPYPGHNFQVTVTGVSDDGSAVSGAFSEVSGLEVETKEIEYRNGNEARTMRKVVGLTTYGKITCKRGATGHVEFWNWVRKAVDGQVQRAEGSIILQDENHQEVMRWNFTRAWPCKYTGPTFNAANNEIAMESLEICVEELYLDTPKV